MEGGSAQGVVEPNVEEDVMGELGLGVVVKADILTVLKYKMG